MNKEEMLKMSAGKGADALVHKYVFGRLNNVDNALFTEIPPYSTYIAAAWTVVEKVKETSTRERPVEITFYHGLWHCDFGQSIHTECFDESLPLAICRAALLAVNNA